MYGLRRLAGAEVVRILGQFGSVQFKEARAVMMVTDVRTGAQVTVAKGRAQSE